MKRLATPVLHRHTTSPVRTSSLSIPRRGPAEMPTRDVDIRTALHSTEIAEYAAEPGTLVLDELGICQGDFRIDIAVVNGALHGYEIKSDRDTLSRLPAQAEAYGKVFDTVTLVAGRTHLDEALRLVPDWWRVLVAYPSRREGTELEVVREGGENAEMDPVVLAQLLWRDELVDLLNELGAPKRLLRRPRWDLWPALAEYLEPAELSSAVRRALKARQGWRDSPQSPVAEGTPA